MQDSENKFSFVIRGATSRYQVQAAADEVAKSHPGIQVLGTDEHGVSFYADNTVAAPDVYRYVDEVRAQHDSLVADQEFEMAHERVDEYIPESDEETRIQTETEAAMDVAAGNACPWCGYPTHYAHDEADCPVIQAEYQAEEHEARMQAAHERSIAQAFDPREEQVEVIYFGETPLGMEMEN